MNLPITDFVEQAVTKQINAMVGNNDMNLNTIIKMSLLNEINPLDETKITDVLISIFNSNLQ